MQEAKLQCLSMMSISPFEIQCEWTKSKLTVHLNYQIEILCLPCVVCAKKFSARVLRQVST